MARADAEGRIDGESAALHLAVENGLTEDVQGLLAAKADLEAQNGDGSRALHIAASRGHAEIAKALLDAKADIEAKSAEEMTALHLAAGLNKTAVLRALADARADLEAQNASADRPLHLAAKCGCKDAALALIDSRADPEALGVGRLSAASQAASLGHKELASLLAEIALRKRTTAQVRKGCAVVLAATSDIRVDFAAAERLAKELDLDAARSTASTPKTCFPLQFDGVEDEVNFLAVLNVLDFGHRFRDLLHNEAGTGVHQTLVRGMLGLRLGGHKLSAEDLVSLSRHKLEHAFGLKSKIMEKMPGLPAEIEVDGPLASYFKGLLETAHRLGTALKRKKQASLGAMVMDVLESTPGSALSLVRALVELLPDLAERGVHDAKPAKELTKDDRVRVVGLAGRPELNGRVGSLGDYDTESGRWALHLDAGKPVRVKPERVEAVVEVDFAARAQTLAVELSRRFGKEDPFRFGFQDLAELVAQAGSGVLPAVLRQLGVLVLDESLAATIDTKQPVSVAADVALRAGAVVACDAIAEAAKASGEELHACELDAFLWDTVAKRDQFSKVERHVCEAA